MSLFLRGRIFHYDFFHKGKRYQGSTTKDSRSEAELVEAGVKKTLRRPTLGYLRQQYARAGKFGRTWKQGGEVNYSSYHRRVRHIKFDSERRAYLGRLTSPGANT